MKSESRFCIIKNNKLIYKMLLTLYIMYGIINLTNKKGVHKMKKVNELRKANKEAIENLINEMAVELSRMYPNHTEQKLRKTAKQMIQEDYQNRIKLEQNK